MLGTSLIMIGDFLPFASVPRSIPTVSEQEARDALMEEVSEHLCYGSKAARDLQFVQITPSNAFHVSRHHSR